MNRCNTAVGIFLGALISSAACAAGTSPKPNASSAEPATGKELPGFSLMDPRGKVFTRIDALQDGAVFVVTAPILSDKSDQEGWAKYLKETKHRGKARLVFLEDMSPSAFKGPALSQMKKECDPAVDPLLLIDPNGEMRQKLGVEKEHTVVLVYDRKGRLVHEERGKPSESGANLIWKALD
jgi:hypothetical protein